LYPSFSSSIIFTIFQQNAADQQLTVDIDKYRSLLSTAESKKEEVKEKDETKPEQVKSDENKAWTDKKPEQVKSDETKPEQVKEKDETIPEQVKSDESKPEQVKSDEFKPEQVKSDESKPEQVKSDETKPEQVKSDESKPLKDTKSLNVPNDNLKKRFMHRRFWRRGDSRNTHFKDVKINR